MDAIRSYISGVHTLHLFLGASYPHVGSFSLKLTIKGLVRARPHMPRRALAIGPELLLQFRKLLNLSCPVDCTIWCLFLLAFFLMARKSNLVPVSRASFDPRKQLRRQDVFIGEGFLLVLFEVVQN